MMGFTAAIDFLMYSKRHGWVEETVNIIMAYLPEVIEADHQEMKMTHTFNY